MKFLVAAFSICCLQTPACFAAADLPTRIVTLAPSAAEWVMEFGLESSQVVGVAEYTDFPKSLTNHPTVGPYHKINLEKVLALKPTLVVATRDGNIKEQVDRIQRWGIPVVVLDGTSLKTIRDSIAVLGAALQMPGKAKTMTEAWDLELSDFNKKKMKSAGGAGKEDPMIFVELGQNPWITVGRNSFIREAIELAGAKNFGTVLNGSYPKVQFEKILQSDPDWILVPLMNDTPERRAEVFASWKKFPSLKAFKSKQICVVTWNEIMRPVRRLLTGVAKLSALLQEKKADGAYCGP